MATNVKYFKYFEDNKSDELVTYSLVYDRNLNENSGEELPVKVKTYFLEDYETRECIAMVEYKNTTELNKWKKTQPSQINLTEIQEDEYLALRNANRVYKMELAQSHLERAAELSSSVVNLETPAVELDANEEAMIRFTYLVTLANAKYNLAVAQGTAPSEAVKIYDTSFNWKGADNTWKQIKISDIANALEKSVMNLQLIWTKYN